MKVDSIPLPSSENPVTTLVRIMPETAKDRRILDRMEIYLRATNAVVARPQIDKEKALSILFTSHVRKKNGKEKN